MSETNTRVIGVVLAGGRSSRFNGVDKTFIPLCGKPLLSHVIERLTPQVERVAISSNTAPEKFVSYGCDVIADVFQDAIGPLAGIHAVLRRWPDREIVTVAVDLPFLPYDLVKRLRSSSTENTCTFASSGERHTFAIWWPPGLHEEVEEFIKSGRRRLKEWLEYRGRAVVLPPGDDRDMMFNINTPADLAAAEARLKT